MDSRVVYVRIVVPEVQPRPDYYERACPGDENGAETLRAVATGSAGPPEPRIINAANTALERFRTDGVSVADRRQGFNPQDIIVVGNHPFGLIGGQLMGHAEAERQGAAVRLSLTSQDTLVYVSDRSFVVAFQPQPHELQVAGGAAQPFLRPDHPFVSLQGADGLHRVATGPLSPAALPQYHYKATIFIGPARVDPDLYTHPA
ncbi:MAG: hypothetical protein U0Q12_02200 [Vicinamibacterales bacterium]